jgi:antitoxin PrlF
MSQMKISSKGQVTIPKRFRESLGLRSGTEVRFAEDGGDLVIQPITRKRSNFADWMARARGTATTPFSTDELMKFTRGED